MTREEAMCYLHNPEDDECCSEKGVQAYQMAIKALEQEPCEDAVSRDDVLKVFGDVHPLDYNTNAYIRKIEELPSVQPEPKTGHWKHNKCDVCGASRPPLFDNFCPNCGAKMIEPQESEE